MNNYPEQAKAFQEALRLGAVNLKEVVNWADTAIARDDTPTIGHIDLALCKKTSDAVTFLNELATSANDEQSFKILFGILQAGLKKGRCSYQDVSKRLYFWAAYETNISGYGDLLYFWDALDLAENGQHGELHRVRNELLEFLNKHKA